MRSRPVVGTIAGSDSGGGAGLQADLRTFTSLGTFGVTVVTSVTAQNTVGVSAIYPLPPSFVEAQLKAVLDDFDVRFMKTGVLPTAEVVEVVRRKVLESRVGLVLDPVMVAKSGDRLAGNDVLEALKNLAKTSLIITPNLAELELLTGSKIDDLNTLEEAAALLSSQLGTNVLAKGGERLKGEDVVVIDGRINHLRGTVAETKDTHGSGDVLSAAITSLLARGRKLHEAVREAKEFTTMSITSGMRIGKGRGPVDPFANVERLAEREKAREELEELVLKLEERKELIVALLKTEDKANLGYMTPYSEVATLAGGIIRYMGWIKVDGPIVFGVQNLVSTALRRTGSRLGLSTSLTEKLLRNSEKYGLTIKESGQPCDVLLEGDKVVVLAQSSRELLDKLEVLAR
ncbi:bifunctional hydroxymethylpyrimidine kinase/phosphomethylpyrimidine kinase [Sulfodiicoccus acidiphilus]|uniref:Bifunctional hydroxymethylpyrimidine kinase/phosphomethylpyrimidine kinase n=1 Tax=Sulfodiicoccus acidiphilus TaxID=1670455 RepID=A0A348B483_9CREN|nr:bifunctional hydroxymethylpyrimidine kinase/phosphomethylpyrimidine kinase [Sulfodiicoccus acidiphilus]BBD72985.1 bifunctional hydroxymethylpyrimidine kinase/phosphomethylpyrimidine kinase [Sulfodiicoccus acidiphilus]GGT87555.1 bifunctional hydroxymethylpyrimidine kinase/phosphomethylpyrimidine kinase [Sulfodiicoccus acidiphilus]